MMSMRHNLQQHARRVLAHSNRNRLFSSYTNRTLWSSNQILQSRIESALSDQKSKLSTVLEQWRQQHGNQLNPSLVRGIVEKLQESKRFPEALDVSEWMIERKICNLVPEDFAARFHLIENVLGLGEAEKFFESVPENLRGESLYTALLNSYARSAKPAALDRAESTFEKMRELGLLLKPSPYHSMTSLYRSLGKRDKFDEILREMKENNVRFDSLTVNNALRAYAAASDVAVMDKFLDDWGATATLQLQTTLDMAKAYLRSGSKGKSREMLGRAEQFKDRKSYEELLRLYGLYGEEGYTRDVYRIWDLYKETRRPDNEGYLILITSLLKLGAVNGAEKSFKEWERSGLEYDPRIPQALASGYRKRGMVCKADKMIHKMVISSRMCKPITPVLQELGLKGSTKVKPSELRDLIKSLTDSNQFSKALEASTWMCEKEMFTLFPEDYAARLHLIEKVLGLKEAKEFFQVSIPKNMKGNSVYDTMLTSYTRSHETLLNAENVMVLMEELGFLSKLSPFSKMISLYSKLGKRIEVEKLLKKMNEKNIELDSVTMNNVLRVYSHVSALELMETYKSHWVDNDEVKLSLEVETMDSMAKAYEREGLTLKAMEMSRSKEDVLRLWDEYKVARRGLDWNEGYRGVIRALLKLGDVKGAQEIYGEWEASEGTKFDARIPGLLISRYCEDDDQVKLSDVVNSSRQKLKWRRVKMFTEDLGFACLGVVGASPMIWGLYLILKWGMSVNPCLTAFGCIGLIVAIS
ncbi:unnamed protein product [Microthlaspi erraticum]|uniref:Pentacotripeptide-repeat region of PRORP domain-containing protein n=1 Tax=Microthlaspi erraticum TaxID=1685480 RepID=A0A6D2KYR7_9BRAS|nr:unnamed protein product [Microthlaspi erraticum]